MENYWATPRSRTCQFLAFGKAIHIYSSILYALTFRLRNSRSHYSENSFSNNFSIIYILSIIIRAILFFNLFSQTYYQWCIDMHLILMHVNYILSDFQYIYVTAVYANDRNRRTIT